jgi:hypothetical protein
MAGERTFLVRLLFDGSKSRAGLKLLSGDFAGFGKEITKTVPSFAAMAVGATAAFGAVAAAMTHAVKTAMEDQKSQAELQRQLEKTFGANDALTASAERYISITQLRTGTSDNELRTSLGTLVRATGDYQQSLGLLNTAQDISAATGRDLGSVTIALAKASQGQFTALSKLGIPIDAATKKSKDFNKVLADLNGQFGGASATAANTFGGQMKIIGTQVNEIWEAIGKALLPYLQKFTDFLVKNVAPAVQRITTVMGEKGLVGGFQQLIFESGGAGTAVVGVFKAMAIGAANAINILAKAYYLTKATFELTTRDFVGAAKDFYHSTQNFIDVGSISKQFDAIAIPVNNYKLSIRDAINQQTNFKGSVEDTPPELNKTSKTLKNATDRLKEYSDSLKSATSAQKSYDSATKSSSAATKSKNEADAALAEAQAKFDKISQGYGAGSPEAIAAQKALDKATRDQERATYAVEEAIYSVADAEMNLTKVRQDPESSPMDIRRAEIGLAEAKLAVTDATDAQTSSTKDLNDQQQILNDTIYGATIGSAIYTEYEDALTTAKERQAEAIDAVTTALENEATALQNLKTAQEAFYGARSAYSGTSTSAGMPEFIQPNDPRYNLGAGFAGGKVSSQSAPTIIVNASIADAGLPQMIVDALKTYNNTIGTVPVRTK